MLEMLLILASTEEKTATDYTSKSNYQAVTPDTKSAININGVVVYIDQQLLFQNSQCFSSHHFTSSHRLRLTEAEDTEVQAQGAEAHGDKLTKVVTEVEDKQRLAEVQAQGADAHGDKG